jgi:hypothetical protein
MIVRIDDAMADTLWMTSGLSPMSK